MVGVAHSGDDDPATLSAGPPRLERRLVELPEAECAKKPKATAAKRKAGK